MMEQKKFGVSGSTLKIMALLIMLIDHIGAVIVVRIMSAPGFDHDFWSSLYWPLRNVGRLAFPIFCFLLVEGFLHTSNRKKYLGRLLLFALISEIPFDLALTGNVVDFWFQNVFWELSVGIIGMMIMESINESKFSYVLQTVLRLMAIAVLAIGAEALQLDYGMNGIISIIGMYVFCKNRLIQLLIGAISFCWEPVAPMAFFLLALYNGKRGRSIKYAFYIFYPTHLLILYIIACVIGCL